MDAAAMGQSLAALADALAKLNMPVQVEGDPARVVGGVATLEDAGPGDISFLSNAKYEKMLASTRAGAVIVSTDQTAPEGLALLRTRDPYAAMCAIMILLHGYRRHPDVGIDGRAVIHPSSKLGEGASVFHGVTICENVAIGRNATIYPGCFIGPGCRIGDDCILYANVVIYDGCVLGHRVTVHANSTIGEDGLGYAPHEGRWVKIPQIGFVEIGDDVEIGANCSIDRATLGRTVIGPGTKFSNQIAIGHGTKIGQHCMFVAQVGLAGSVTVGDRVTMAGKAGVAGHLTIGDNVQVAAMAGVMNDVPADTSVAGAPAFNRKEVLRSWAVFGRLPELVKQVKELEAELERLKKSQA
jgi:UDP-3-O-[3-hydroxymyristoyl] glucosamine N-acyltransferase